MKKRLTGLLLALCMLLALLPTTLFTAGAASRGTVSYPVDGGKIFFDPETGMVTWCEDTVTSAVIPAEIGGVAVTAIWDWAFSDCGSLTSVTIPDSVTTIWGHAFFRCYNLATVTLGEGVETIGVGAFEGCTSLSEITIPASVTSIAADAFTDCGSLVGIWVDEGNLTYSSDADGTFYDKEKTTLIRASKAVSGSYEILPGVKTIGGGAFACRSGLTDVSIPDSVTVIGNSAFALCTGLTEVIIPDSVTEIGAYAFDGCTGLWHVAIGNGVTSIGERAFFECTGLIYATVGSSVTSIGEFAFCTCSNLASLYFYGDAPEVGYGVFGNNDAYLTLYYLEGKSGWTSPEWNEMPTATWDGETIPEEILASIDFSDINGDEWYAEGVYFAVASGLMNGMGNGKFEPDTGMTRAMLVTVLWRLCGSPVEGENTFTDLTQDWYIPAVTWAAHYGIVNGVGDGKFDPDANITREQLATILCRFSSLLGLDVSSVVDLNGFPDANKVSDYARESLCWAVDFGLVTGTQEGNKTYLDPLGNATRAQVATILMRYLVIFFG